MEANLYKAYHEVDIDIWETQAPPSLEAELEDVKAKEKAYKEAEVVKLNNTYFKGLADLL